MAFSAVRFCSYTVCQCFSTGVPQNLRVLQVVSKGSAGLLVLIKNMKLHSTFAAIRCIFQALRRSKMYLRSGLHPELCWRSLQRSADPFPRTPSPLSAQKTWVPWAINAVRSAFFVTAVLVNTYEQFCLLVICNTRRLFWNILDITNMHSKFCTGLSAGKCPKCDCSMLEVFKFLDLKRNVTKVNAVHMAK